MISPTMLSKKTFLIWLIMAILFLPAVTAGSVVIKGYRGTTLLETETCTCLAVGSSPTSGTNTVDTTCGLSDFTKDKHLDLEGDYYLDITAGCGASLASNALIFTVDWNLYESDCAGKFGADHWNDTTNVINFDPATSANCCEEGLGENLVTGNDASVSCCTNLVDADGDRTVSIGGQCLHTRAYWADTQGSEISSSDIEDTVQLKIDNVNLSIGDTVVFEIFETDGGVGDHIRTVAELDAITGVVDDNHNLIANWTISVGDMASTSDYDDFYFRVSYADIGDFVSSDYKESDSLVIIQDYNDTLMEVTIVQPACGANFTKGSNVTIYIEAEDTDNFIDGNITLNGAHLRTFINGDTVFNHTFVSAGNYQIVADAFNDRGRRARHIANIMIIDTGVNGSKYIAACITEPKDFMDFEGSVVPFDASATRAIEIIGNVAIPTLPGSKRLSWYWTFDPQGIIKNFINTDDSEAYEFTGNFPIAGGNSAALRVEFE